MRVGFVVPKHGKRIVDRNRLKRHLREAARLELLPRGREADVRLDVLLRARPAAYETDFASLRDEVRAIAEELC